MRLFIKYSGIIAVLAVFGLSLFSCSEGRRGAPTVTRAYYEFIADSTDSKYIIHLHSDYADLGVNGIKSPQNGEFLIDNPKKSGFLVNLDDDDVDIDGSVVVFSDGVKSGIDLKQIIVKNSVTEADKIMVEYIAPKGENDPWIYNMTDNTKMDSFNSIRAVNVKTAANGKCPLCP